MHVPSTIHHRHSLSSSSPTRSSCDTIASTISYRHFEPVKPAPPPKMPLDFPAALAARQLLTAPQRAALDKALYDSLNSTADYNKILKMIQKGANPANYAPVGDREDTPLTLAVAFCGKDIVKLLLDAGCSPERGLHRDSRGSGGQPKTALATAIERKDLDILNLLLLEGEDKADPNRKIGEFPEAPYPLHLACGIGATLGVPLVKAITTASPMPMVRALIKAGADVNAFHGESKRGYGSVLTYACSKGAPLELVQLLLDSGAGVNAPLGGGMHSPLQAAVTRCDVEVVKLLLEKGANVNEYGGAGSGSAWDAAKKRGNKKITKELEEKGAKGKPWHKDFFSVG